MIAVLCALALALAGGKPSWNAALLIDQSGSMRNSHDPNGYALLGPAIFSDLSTEADTLWIHPQGTDPACRPIQLDVNDRMGFKNQLLDTVRTKCQGSTWMQQMVNAIDGMAGSDKDKNLVVNIYDGDCIGGKLSSTYSSCCDERKRRLCTALPPQLINSRSKLMDDLLGTGFVIGVGKKASKENRKPATEFFGTAHNNFQQVRTATSEKDFLRSFKTIFAYILDADSAQVGEFQNRAGDEADIQVHVPQGAAEAWLVALAEGGVGDIRALGNNSGRATLAPDQGWDFVPEQSTGQIKKGYEILHLTDNPKGNWGFAVDTPAERGSFMLLVAYDVDFDISVPPVCRIDEPCRLLLHPRTEISEEAVASATFKSLGEQRFNRLANGDYELILRPDAELIETVPITLSQPNAFRKVKHAKVYVSNARCNGVDDQILPIGTWTYSYNYMTKEGERINEELDAVWLTMGNTPKQSLTLQPDEQGPTWKSAPIDLRQTRELQVKVEYRKKDAEKIETCVAQWDLRPAVQLPEPSTNPVALGPIEWQNKWLPFGSCSGDQSEAACGDCGHCAGAVWEIDLSGTQAEPGFIGSIEATAIQGPSGVRAYWLDGPAKGKKIELNAPIEWSYPSTQRLRVAACSDVCAGAGDFSVNLSLTAPGVFPINDNRPKNANNSYPPPLDLRTELQLNGSLEPTSWWGCNVRKIYAAIAALIALFVAYGFIRPLRFPKVGEVSQPNFPARYNVAPVNNPSGLLEGEVSTDLIAPVKTWYRNEVLYLDGTNLNLSRHASGAVARIELRREKGKAPTAWFIPLNGTDFRLAPHVPGQSIRSYIPLLINEAHRVPAEGAPLKLDHIYVIKRGEWVALFTR